MSKKSTNTALILSLVGVVGVIIGYQAYKPAVQNTEHTEKITPEKEGVNRNAPRAQAVGGRLPERKVSNKTPRIEVKPKITIPPSAIPNELTVQFKSDEDYQNFLGSLKERGLTLLGQSNVLRSVRLGFSRNSDLNGISGGELDFNFAVTIPGPSNAAAQEDAIGFGDSALEWLGLSEDNTTWGEGVTVAVIDTGLNDHLAFNSENGELSQINLTELAPDQDQLSHGTAVASIISGDHAQTQGVAPAADILAIRVTNEDGASDAFTLADAIVQAADNGADVINISMGTSGNSAIIANAVAYAQEQGSVIVASAGNEGVSGLAYPAANEGVISVGAVEAGGEHLDFSNTGDQLDIVAPGFQVNAAWEDSQLVQFSGTSASAPYVSGAIAAVLSLEPELSAAEAAERVIALSNDAGAPGADSEFGVGVLAIDRLVEFGTSGVFDAAVTGQVIDESTTNQVLVTVQNQGTETLINSPVTITGSLGLENYNITALKPGETQTFAVPIGTINEGEALTIESTVGTVQTDKDTSNNSRSTTFESE